MNIDFLKIYKNNKKKIYGASVIISLILLYPLFTFTNYAGYTQHTQNTFTGSVNIYTTPGVKFKIPFFTIVTIYKQVATISYNGRQNNSIMITRNELPVSVRFADTYTGKIPVSIRFRLPANKDDFIKLHNEFRSYENVVESLLVTTSRDVIVNTATQYTGEEFFQGGLNQFKTVLGDQLRNGVYETKRKQVEIEQMGLASVGLNQENSNKLEQNKTLVWKTVPVLNDNGAIKRISNPLDTYGIKTVQVTVNDPIPEKKLNGLLSDKKTLVADRIKTVQEQETAKEQAKTAQLLAEIERTKAKQMALKTKDLAIIAKQQEVESAEKQAEKELVEATKIKDLSTIQKAKELEIARANVEIQKANFESAQFEAKAIKETGIAQADVLKANYNARIPEIYLAELQRDVANVMYTNLTDFNVTMPQNMVTLGGGNNKLEKPTQTNLDVLSSFATIGVMDNLSNKVK